MPIDARATEAEDSVSEIVIRPTALLAAIAVALLGVSGAGGAHAQTPKRGGTVVIASVEFPCLNVLVSQCGNPVAAAVLYGAYEIGPGYGRRPKLVSHVDVTTKPPFTLTYHIRPEARWSDGVPITSGDFEFTYRERLKYPTSEDDPHKTRVLRVRRVDAKTVRVVLRSRFFFWRESLFDFVLPQHALQGKTSRTSGGTRSTIRARAGRSEAALSSSNGGTVGRSLSFGVTPTTGGHTARTWIA